MFSASQILKERGTAVQHQAVLLECISISIRHPSRADLRLKVQHGAHQLVPMIQTAHAVLMVQLDLVVQAL